MKTKLPLYTYPHRDKTVKTQASSSDGRVVSRLCFASTQAPWWWHVPSVLDLDHANHPRFEAQTGRDALQGSFVIQTTKPSCTLLKAWLNPDFVAKQSNHSDVITCRMGRLLDFTIILARRNRRRLHQYALCVHHAGCSWLRLVSLGPSIQIYSRSPRTFRLTFTTHRRVSCRNLHLHFKAKR